MKLAIIRTSLVAVIGLFVACTQATESKRIITAGGTITEVVFALGSGEQVVGIDSSSNYPQPALSKPVVGYYRDLAAEGLLSLQPTEVLALEGAGRAEALTLIEQAGVPVTLFKKPVDIDSLFTLIRQVSNRLDKHEAGEQLIANINGSLSKVELAAKSAKSFKSSAPVTSKPLTAISLLSLNERGAVVAGLETVPTFLFTTLGIVNPVTGHNGFKPIGLESLALMKPDFLLVPSHVAMSLGGRDNICKHPSLSLLSVAQTCQVLILDSLLSLAITPRIAQSLQAIDEYTRAL